MELDPETWIDEHGDYLFRYAFLRLRDRTLAEDAVQETFLAALKSRNGFEGQSGERTWLTGILKHKILDYFRKAGREQPLENAETVPVDAEESFHQTGELAGHWKRESVPGDWGAFPADSLERNEFWEIFQQALGTLPDKMAHAFVLKELEELSGKEICGILNITEGNLWVLLHRARMQLRHAMEKYSLRDKRLVV